MKILIKKGFKLNPNEKIVSNILKAIERNEGNCPCIHPENDGSLQCPCESYRLKDKCYCKLYIREE